MSSYCAENQYSEINSIFSMISNWRFQTLGVNEHDAVLWWERFRFFWWMCCQMFTYVPSGWREHIFFLRGQKNIQTRHYSKFTDNANWNKNDAIAKGNFSGTSDSVRHLMTFRIISNEMTILLLFLCRWYFSCLFIYSQKRFNIYFHEQMFFYIFVARWIFWPCGR